jgi:L-threonylcarbamoyladenylate synthase
MATVVPASAAAIKKAARIVRRGGIVIFPTETVYGLGGNALNKRAIKNIFIAKNRPADNPLIVHIGAVADVGRFAINIPESAHMLFACFWPGPLTVVLKKAPNVPNIATGGLDSIALRMPDNKVALRLIRKSGVPIAAPSANISGSPSSTTAQHALHDLGDRVDMILDGGAAPIGIESTVIDLTGRTPRILRPGAITKKDIERCLGRAVLSSPKKNSKIRSPGMKYRHYAPKAKLFLVEGGVSELQRVIVRLKKRYDLMGVITDSPQIRSGSGIIPISAGKSIQDISKNLFNCLRLLDARGVSIIIMNTVPKHGLGIAVMNRLEKAASRIIRKAPIPHTRRRRTQAP